jgi:hypothetical protein
VAGVRPTEDLPASRDALNTSTRRMFEERRIWRRDKAERLLTSSRRFSTTAALCWNCWTGALARLARANALQAGVNAANSSRAGVPAPHEPDQISPTDRDAARVRAAYKNFLTLWKDADPYISILKQAKTEYTKLQ